MADLTERFEQEHLPRKRPRTAGDYRAAIRLHIALALKNLKVQDVTFAAVDRLHRSITRKGSPYAANRAVALLSKMFSLAVVDQPRYATLTRGAQDKINPHCRSHGDGRKRKRRHCDSSVGPHSRGRLR